MVCNFCIKEICPIILFEYRLLQLQQRTLSLTLLSPLDSQRCFFDPLQRQVIAIIVNNRTFFRFLCNKREVTRGDRFVLQKMGRRPIKMWTCVQNTAGVTHETFTRKKAYFLGRIVFEHIGQLSTYQQPELIFKRKRTLIWHPFKKGHNHNRLSGNKLGSENITKLQTSALQTHLGVGAKL